MLINTTLHLRVLHICDIRFHNQTKLIYIENIYTYHRKDRIYIENNIACARFFVCIIRNVKTENIYLITASSFPISMKAFMASSISSSECAALI